MVYKRLYLILLILIFFSLKNILYANIIYDKNNIIISELDLSYYKEMHYEKYNESLNNSKALKNLVIIKNVINSLKENNKDFLTRIDESIYNEIGKELEINILGKKYNCLIINESPYDEENIKIKA